jgi:hypothetical protein
MKEMPKRKKNEEKLSLLTKENFLRAKHKLTKEGYEFLEGLLHPNPTIRFSSA